MSLKKMWLVLAVLALAVSSCSKSVDDIIDKNIEARGGEDNIRKVKSVIVDARISSMGMDIPMKIYIQEPNRMRVDMNLLGQDVTTVYDGNQGWVASGGRVERIPEDKLAQIKDQMNQQFNFFQTQLFDYKKKNLKVALEGKEKVDGRDAYKIKVIMKDSTENTYFIDASTYVDIRMDARSKPGADGKPTTAEVYFKDYKKINNILIPHLIEVKNNGKTEAKLVYDKIRINEKIDNSLFQMPQI